MASKDDAAYYGTWKIVECVSLAGLVEPTGIEGTVFHLDANGDVSWRVAEDAEPLPFFSCETYQVTSGICGELAILKFYGTYAGHMIEFRVEVSDDLMLLTYERCCMLQCQKISSCEPKEVVPFDLLPALEEGYFSDLTIISDTGKQFAAHTMILCLNAPLLDWAVPPSPLDRLPSDVIETLLHFLYAECLPEKLSEDTAQKCIEAAERLAGFERFTETCVKFVKNMALKQQMMSLIGDVHTCLDKVIELYSDKFGMANAELVSNPTKLCCVVKHTACELAIGCSHSLMFCDLFFRRKGELSREERHEIIKYTKTRLPIVLKQLHTFLSLCKDLTASLKTSQIHDISSYFVPEIQAVLELGRRLFLDVRSALEQTITTSMNTVSNKQAEKARKKGQLGDALGHTLKHALHLRELKKLRRFHEKMTEEFCILTLFEQKFKGQTNTERVAFTTQNIDCLIHEIPLIIQRLEDFMAAKVSWKDWKYLFKLGTSKLIPLIIQRLEDFMAAKVSWKDWKYLFKLGTSKLAWALSKVQASEPLLRATIQETRDLVGSDVFTKSLKSLNLILLDPSVPHVPSYTQSSEVRSLCCPPSATDSNSVRELLKLLQSGRHTDVEFDVIEARDCGETVIDQTTVSGYAESDHCPIRAHCVIVAARCDWFKRALLSGMRESLDKRIVVHDTSVQLFRVYLNYLYSASVDLSTLSTDQLADMMTLADKFETDSLKQLCEQSLCKRLHDDTCLYLLTLADQLNATTLTGEAISYVAKHQAIIDCAHFDALPTHLKLAIEDRIYWHRVSENEQLHRTDTSSSSLSEVDDLINNTHISCQQARDASLSSSSDECDLTPAHSQQLQECVQALRDVLGDTVADDSLREVAMAADYDVNRALNYLFSRDN